MSGGECNVEEADAHARAEEPWYVKAFRREYLDVYAHRDANDAKRAVDFCLTTLGLEAGDTLLDLCCGAGRHLALFEQRGVVCTGVDLSHDLLERARLDGVKSRLIRADVRALPVSDGVFEALVNLFSSFGYFEEEREHLVMLREARRVLAPSAGAMFDIMNPAWVASNLKTENEERRAGLVIHSLRRIDSLRRRVEKRVKVTREASGDLLTEYTESVRMFESSECDSLLAEAGFDVVARYGDFDGRTFDEVRSPRQIVYAKAR